MYGSFYSFVLLDTLRPRFVNKGVLELRMRCQIKVVLFKVYYLVNLGINEYVREFYNIIRYFFF